ncbi:MAG: SURF1 family protein [Gammaproteobacteria bacterium]|nr:SURF1 family protein [Gammaproteobacteria bacterium]
MNIRRSLVPTVMMAVCLPVLLMLGFWQLNRADYKQRQLDSYLARGQLGILPIPAAIVDAEEVVHYRVSATGVYEVDRQFLVDNITLRGRPGYHVITPLRIAESNTRVLVNRGWVPWGDDRNVLPQVPPPSRPLRVQGRAIRPADEFFTLRDESDNTEWESRWQNLDMDRFARLVGYPVQPIIILLDPIDEDSKLRQEWDVPRNNWIERHRAYAFQWFALAATLVVLAIFSLRRSRSK